MILALAMAVAGQAAPVRVCGTFISGPASTPLGFFRTIGADNVPSALATPAPPPNFAPDPFGLRPIASVVAKNRIYTVTLLGVEDLAGESVYHLQLVPNFAPELHPLRDLWVDTHSFEVVQLTYARRAENGAPDGDVKYRFAQVGPSGVWAIVRIEAELPVRKSAAPARLESNLANITFPTGETAPLFDAPCPTS